MSRAGGQEPDPEGVASRRLALEVLRRVDEDGAYANLALSSGLSGSGLDQADRNFVTDLVYGTVRMQRALDHEADQVLDSSPPPAARRALRLGIYQLRHRGDIPAYAAVSASVEATPKRFRGLANAVLRKISRTQPRFPDLATELSYPNWIVSRLEADLGADRAHAALRAMNGPATVHKRADGYVQDIASQRVTDAVGAVEGELILDSCAAPGGKATGMAAAGAVVLAGDLHEQRVGLVTANAGNLGLDQLFGLQMDARCPPVAEGSLDAVLVDAPCSGLGVLRRRADARWRVRQEQVDRLTDLQLDILKASVPLLKPEGRLVYSVCTLTAAESTGVDDRLSKVLPALVPMEPPPGDWQPWGRGWLLLPDEHHDGMSLFRYTLA